MSSHPAVVPYLHPLTVPTPFPVGPVNLHLAEGDPLTLIDTGRRFPPAREALWEGMSDLGLRQADLDRIPLRGHTGLRTGS